MRTVLHEGRFLRLVQEGSWEFVERANSTGAVVVVAVTPTGGLLLVEQHRPPVRGVVIELPAGLAGDGDADEDFATAAARELEEETGWRAGRVAPLVAGPSNPGLSAGRMHLFLATELSRSHHGGGVEGESITVHEIPLAEVEAWIHGRVAEGAMVDPKVFAGLHFALRAGI